MITTKDTKVTKDMIRADFKPALTKTFVFFNFVLFVIFVVKDSNRPDNPS